MSGLDRSPIRFAVRCGSCGERATTTISLRGVTVPVCLRHYNVWKTPDFDADAAMLAEAHDVMVLSGDALQQALYEVDAVHQFHGDICLCGFSSSRSRSRTEHITTSVMVRLAASESDTEACGDER